MRRRLLWATATAALASLLAGCTGIPYVGGVNKGVPVADISNSEIQFLPAGPATDSSPEQILLGFVDAATSPTGEWAIARQYLAPDFARTWNPSAGVLIDRGNRSISEQNSTSFTLSTEVEGSVDAQGNFKSAATADTTEFKYSFAKVDGQWRIAGGPNGVVIDARTFPRVFSPSTLYFYSPNFDNLVPDVRWFPARSATTTRVVAALMRGPSTWLSESGVAVNSIPIGATLVAEAVPVQAGSALINLDARSFKAGDVTTNRMLRQIAASLSGLVEVSTVEVLFSGVLQGKLAVPAAQSLAASSGSDQALVIRDGVMGFLAADQVSPIAGLSSAVTALAPSRVALTRDRAQAVVNTATGVSVVRADAQVTPVDARSGLIPAAIDGSSFIWTVPEDSPRVVLVTGLAGTARSVRVPWTDAKRISFLSFSPDGSRLMAGLVTASGNKICIAGVRRGDDLWPNDVGPCAETAAPTGTLLSGAWLDGARVAVLSTTNVSNLRISTVGGKSIDVTPPVGAIEVTGSGTLLAPRILTRNGDIYEQYSASRWSIVGSKISLLGNSP